MAVDRWAWVFADPDGTEDDMAVRATRRRLRLRLDSPSETSFRLDGRTREAAALGDGLDRDVIVYRNDERLFRGRIASPSDDLHAGGHDVDCVAYDYRAALERRIAWTDLQYTGDDLETIAWGLVDHTQQQTDGGLGIGREGTPTGIDTDRNIDAGTQIAAAVDELSTVGDGFDWDIPAETHQLTLWSPARGGDGGTYIWGGNVIRVRRNFDARAFANAHLVTGNNIAAQSRYSPVGDVGRWERHEATRLDSTGDLSAKADGIHAAEAALLPSWRVTVRPGRFPSCQLGDVCQLAVDAGRLQIDEQLRATEIDITVDRDGEAQVVVVLGHPLPQREMRLIRQMQRRLTAIEAR